MSASRSGARSAATRQPEEPAEGRRDPVLLTARARPARSATSPGTSRSAWPCHWAQHPVLCPNPAQKPAICAVARGMVRARYLINLLQKRSVCCRDSAPENRGVPGSSPGLAIGNGPGNQGLFRCREANRPEARRAEIGRSASRARRTAWARPWPRAAPLTTATLPSSRPIRASRQRRATSAGSGRRARR